MSMYIIHIVLYCQSIPVSRCQRAKARSASILSMKIIDELLNRSADKDTVIIGLGGGVITDIAGYVASIYKRGVPLIQVPTSILGMVDAAVGGKNGVNTAHYKNMVGTIYQPEAVIFDQELISTLPKEEWINGFAEVIKHACIKDESLFRTLQKHTIDDYFNNPVLTASLIKENVLIKTGVVLGDELETGDRMLLNFGHTLGHAIEKENDLSTWACYQHRDDGCLHDLGGDQ